jgi:tetratricopeptide (TPR) repeat protein
MKLALKHSIATILLMLSLAAPVAAGPLEDAAVAFNKGDCATTLRIIRPLAEQGDAVVQRKLGYFYETGTCVPKNYAEAMKWYRKAADQGDATAQYDIGVMYYNGEGVPRDYAEAMKWFREAADQGSPHAQHAIGLMYCKGEGVPRDCAEAVKWYRKAADQGIAPAQVILAAMYYYGGPGVPRDYAEALKWYLKGAGKTIYIYVLVWIAFSAAVGLGAIARGRDGPLWFLLAWVISPLLAGIILMARPPTGKSLVASRSSLWSSRLS